MKFEKKALNIAQNFAVDSFCVCVCVFVYLFLIENESTAQLIDLGTKT